MIPRGVLLAQCRRCRHLLVHRVAETARAERRRRPVVLLRVKVVLVVVERALAREGGLARGHALPVLRGREGERGGTLPCDVHELCRRRARGAPAPEEDVEAGAEQGEEDEPAEDTADYGADGRGGVRGFRHN